MTTVIVGMLIALLIAGVVVALVAIPARREGREILTPQGEQMMQSARERTVEAVGVARDKVGDLAEKLPVRTGDDAAPAAGSPAAGSPAAGTRASGGAGRATAPSSDIDLRPQTSDAGQHRA